MILSGWGRYPVSKTQIVQPRSEAELVEFIGQSPLVARGNGRSYGDAAVGAPLTIDMRRFSRMISFDEFTGTLVCEAGVLLADIIKTFLPRGWFPFVTPGTRFVTVGGMIAADVHGKNHHKDGSMRTSVNWLELMDGSGRVHRVSPSENAELFDWTVGGMGLTGIILRASVTLRPVESAWIRQITHAAPNLEAAIERFESNSDTTYSVAWIDCLAKGRGLGRSLVMLGEHAALAELDNRRRFQPYTIPTRTRLRVPLDLPGFCLNRYSVSAFNALYWWRGNQNVGSSLVDWDSYFYPLDTVSAWNRIYGRKGFLQYQCVLPLGSSAAGLRRLLTTIADAGQGSFLAVLKRMGPQGGRYSFPMEGYTLALDFPVREASLALMSRLDEIVLDHGGRFYLAKDARMSPETLRKSDPRTEDFLAMRRQNGSKDHFNSVQSRRLAI